MAKMPKRPEEIFGEVTDEFRNIFGDDLLSITLYGSGATGHYIPGKSDINFLIVLTEAGIDNLDQAIKPVSRLKKRKVATPLFMTKREICLSVDSYPIELLTMKEHYVLVYGEDALGGLSFDPSHLRLQFERELKGKILHLRRGYLETEGQAKQIRGLIRASFTAFISVFKALLFLKGIDIPENRRDIIRSVAGAYTINPDVFLKCADIKEDIDRIPASDVETVFKDYLKEVEKLSTVVDDMNV